MTSTTIKFTPISLATRKGQEPARLVCADDRLVAIIVPISPEDNESDTEGWYLEVGFGPCEADGVLFASFPAVETWVRERLAQAGQGGQRQSDPSQARSATKHRASQEGDDPLRILIVEDDKMQALALEDRLVELGHSVVGIAASAPEAVTAAETQDPNLILMDLRLADGTSGIEAAGEIRNRLGVPSIFMTAYADVQTRVRVEQVRAVELLAKPVSQAALQAALAKAQSQVGARAPR